MSMKRIEPMAPEQLPWLVRPAHWAILRWQPAISRVFRQKTHTLLPLVGELLFEVDEAFGGGGDGIALCPEIGPRGHSLVTRPPPVGRLSSPN